MTRSIARASRPALSLVLSLVCASCASAPSHAGGGATGASAPVRLCEHAVPAESCTRCHPETEAGFKARGDWCPEHGVPETQCLECHPDLTFTPMPPIPPDADLRILSSHGEDVPDLAAELSEGKVTVVDFYADWCVPCREVDRHVTALLGERKDVAYRRINIVSWESAVARRYLSRVPGLPYVIVFDKKKKRVKDISGLDVDALDAAIERAAR